MNERKFEKPRPIPMDKARFMSQTAFATIRSIHDAIVELVTNSDDSYKRLEQDGKEVKGEIKIRVRRLKYGRCENIEVVDFAEGMDKDKLEKALTYGGAVSGFQEGGSVRGLFGRGLKEVIIALGEAEIYSIKDGKLCIADVWWDEKEGLMYKPLETSYRPSKEERDEIGITEGNGTVVRITVTNEKTKCPDYKTLKPCIRNHYAFRDINSSSKRKVILDFESPEKRGLRYPDTHISYEKPRGREIFYESIRLPNYNDAVQIRIYESDEKLDSPYLNAFAEAGLLIKTAGAILDNQLFKYQNEEAGRFFFGEVVWEGLAERLRDGDWGVITSDRTGINWGHQYCKVLREKIEDILEKYIEEKKKELGVQPPPPPPEKTKKMLNKLCSLLNRLAKQELSEVSDIDVGPGEEPFKELTIKPEEANIEIDEKKGYGERPFSVYAPLDILGLPLSESYQAEVKSSSVYIAVEPYPNILLRRYHKYPELYYYGKFKAKGSIVGAEATITCRLGEHTATAVARVAKLKKRGKRKKPIRKGGFFREIKADPRENPEQRVSYDKDNAIIYVFVKFPVVAKYLDNTLSPETREAKAVLAELVGEAYCRFTAREKIDKGLGDYIVMYPAGGIDAFNLAMNDLQKKSLHLIHDIILEYKL